jgi:hypothetical protein
MLVCPACKKSARIGLKQKEERICKKCNKKVDNIVVRKRKKKSNLKLKRKQ